VAPDLIIPVREKRETPGFSGWSVKDGVPHVHPPAEILAGMLTVRLHLDECGADNGPLRVIPGSHRHGKLSAEEIRRLRGETDPVVCSVAAGGALLMKPLLLHASSPAVVPGHRRVLHLEYARDPLPEGQVWGRA
jgi:ectoine hydroxylase-related dioxygenase (phytanoyl-CoA dioxygenase family)